MLRFRRAVIATGARAAEPPITGLKEAGYLTNETVFNFTERPRRLAVIGGGPIGCELAHAFHRLGCEVTLFHKHTHLLEREDAAGIVQTAFQREGVQLVLQSILTQVEHEDWQKRCTTKPPEHQPASPWTKFLSARDALPMWTDLTSKRPTSTTTRAKVPHQRPVADD